MSDRFRGWTRPGPRPPGALGEVADDEGRPVVVESGETLDWIAGHTRIFQYERGHRFSVDDVLCAWFATSHAPRVERALDLGAGIGSVALTVAWRLPGCTMTTIEAQDLSLRLQKKSIAYNGLGPRLTPYLGDLRDEALLDHVAARHGPFDLVTGSPPYWPLGAALPSVHAQAVPARLEVRGDVFDYARAAARVLAPGGHFGLVHQGSQHERVQQALHDAGLAALFVRFVRFKEDAPATTSGAVLVVAARHGDVPRAYSRRSGGKPIVEPDLVLRTRDGRVAPEYATIRLSYGFPPGDADPDEV
ncbi:MAG: methyltransferase [Deltaproteobacteria bacterium]|nr:methyltransferase [Deltaproteobacteria bacterium]